MNEATSLSHNSSFQTERKSKKLQNVDIDSKKTKTKNKTKKEKKWSLNKGTFCNLSVQ